MARRKPQSQADIAAKAAREAEHAREYVAATQMARAAILSQPMPLVAADSDVSAAYGLAERLLLQGERARFVLLTVLAREGVSQEDLTWLCTSGTYVSDRYHAAWWVACEGVRLRYGIDSSGLTFREWFDRDVASLAQELQVDNRLMQRIYGQESPSIRREREDARAEWLTLRQGIHEGTAKPSWI